MAFDTVNAIAKIKGMETCSGPGGLGKTGINARQGTWFINTPPGLPRYIDHITHDPALNTEPHSERSCLSTAGRTRS